MANRKIGQAGFNLIKQYEGCRLSAYQCAAGVWTIGYGHTAGVKKRYDDHAGTGRRIFKAGYCKV